MDSVPPQNKRDLSSPIFIIQFTQRKLQSQFAEVSRAISACRYSTKVDSSEVIGC